MSALHVIATLSGAAASTLPPLQLAGKPTQVHPVALATVRRVDGHLVRTSEWIAYRGDGGREASTLAFDCFDMDDDHAPTGGTHCWLPGDGYRWYWGTGYYAPCVADDMEFDDEAGGRVVAEYDIAWGLGIDTPKDQSFAIAVLTYNEMIDDVDCASTSVGVFPDDFTPASDGVIANFGNLGAIAGWRYANIAGLAALEMLMPDGQSGTYESLQVWIDNNSGEISICPGPCGPVWWGTSDRGGTPNRPGSQGIQILLDDGGGTGWPDGAFDAGIECYDMSNGHCPDPYGNMAAFWIQGSLCTADHDSDGFLTGIDYDLFIADFENACQ